MIKHLLIVFSLCWLLISCANDMKSNKPIVTVSLPVQEYFVRAISDTLVDVNVMIPVTAGHSTYTPLPSQLKALSSSSLYLAIGTLDFEEAWKDRLTSVQPSLVWARLDGGVEPCYGVHCHHDGCSHSHSHAESKTMDPHYWVSPKQAKVMVDNIAREISSHCGVADTLMSARVERLKATIDSMDQRLEQSSAKAFMIYHPALTYLARDYGMVQLTIEQEGKSISPREYAEQIEKARELGVKVVFCQKGYDTERVKGAVDDLGARVVEIQPESADYLLQMEIIIEALK
ncbi:MAG: zinc ABC transporter substrate-binding protein [Bacteroidia bacterium]|nr:zinc ABC transporter substrate-binding protein [Bacteroidia bacterium]